MTHFSFPFDLVGFDLDGTLVDTSEDIAGAVNHALGTIGRGPLPVAAVLARVGGGTRNMLAAVLDDTGGHGTGGHGTAMLDALLPVLLDRYHDHVADRSRPYPGCLDALDALAAAGVRLAVATNKNEALARALLAALGMADRFACVIGGDTLPQAKPSPAPILAMIERCGGGRAAFVGDSDFDVRAAQAAGVPVVACRFGFSGDGVDALGADAVIDDYAGLLPALARLG